MQLHNKSKERAELGIKMTKQLAKAIVKTSIVAVTIAMSCYYAIMLIRLAVGPVRVPVSVQAKQGTVQR